MPGIILASDIFLFSAAVIWIIAASVTDLKKREVPNWLSFSLIAIALAVRGISSILSHQASYFYYSLICLAIFFIIANILYYCRIFGGGDAKLLMALAAILATAPAFAKISPVGEPFLLSFMMNIFVFGFAYGLIYSASMAVKNRRKFSPEFRKISSKIRLIRIAIWILSAVVFVLSAILFFTHSIFALPVLIISLVFFISPLLFAFVKAVENSSMIMLMRPNELAEGDCLIGIIKLKNRTIKPGVHGLSAGDIAALKKENRRVLIKQGLPFVPIFLIALICTIFFSDLLMAFVLSLV